jgi:hypothetical protein
MPNSPSPSSRTACAAGIVFAMPVEADAFDALSELARAQSVLEQAVAIAAKLPIPGLAQRG